MTMRKNEAETVVDNSSRFAYHNEIEPLEGGVRAVSDTPKPEKSTERPRSGRNVPGAGTPAVVAGMPSPEDRLLDISEINRNVGQYYTHKFSLSHREGDEIDNVEPITGEVTLTNTGAALILRGEARTRLRLECGRCLQMVEEPVETEIEEDFDLVSSNSAWSHDEDVHAVDDDVTGAVIKGNILDLGDLLRQYIILATPAQPDCPECDATDAATAAAEAAQAEAPASDNPLKHLAEMLEAKRRQEESGA